MNLVKFNTYRFEPKICTDDLAMITVGMNYEVKPGHEKEFEVMSFKILAALETMTGHVSTRIYRDIQKPTSFLIYSEWQNREAFTHFITSPGFNAAQDAGRGILEARPRHWIFESSRNL